MTVDKESILDRAKIELTTEGKVLLKPPKPENQSKSKQLGNLIGSIVECVVTCMKKRLKKLSTGLPATHVANGFTGIV